MTKKPLTLEEIVKETVSHKLTDTSLTVEFEDGITHFFSLQKAFVVIEHYKVYPTTIKTIPNNGLVTQIKNNGIAIE